MPYPVPNPSFLDQTRHLFSHAPFHVLVRTAIVFFVTALFSATNDAPATENIRRLRVDSGDLVYDASRDLLWLSVRTTSDVYANRVIAVDPATMSVRHSIRVGSDPLVLALSSDDRYLYVSLQGASGYQRIDLNDQSVSGTFALGGDWSGSFYANDMAVVPGEPGALAISLRSSSLTSSPKEVAIFEDNVPREERPPTTYRISNIAFASDGSSLFGYNAYNSGGNEFHRMEVDDSGIRHIDEIEGIIKGNRNRIRYYDGWIIANGVESRLGSALEIQINFLNKKIGSQANNNTAMIQLIVI